MSFVNDLSATKKVGPDEPAKFKPALDRTGSRWLMRLCITRSDKATDLPPSSA